MLHRSCLVADVPFEECAVRDSSIFMSSMQQLLGIKNQRIFVSDHGVDGDGDGDRDAGSTE